jgi:hypothetical protein
MEVLSNMDRKQMIVQRAREFFADRFDDVKHMVQQDRQELHGWEEPAYLRAVLRRAVWEGVTAETGTTAMAVAQTEIGRAAGEPDRGQQREAIGQLLEAAIAALQKASASEKPELTPEEVLGLESAILLYGRPAILVSRGHLASPAPFWNVLEDQREDIELAHRGVGRIEMLGHPEYDWAGTGFLVNDTTLLTTRRTIEIFAETNGEGQWQFRPGITGWMNYQEDYQKSPSAAYRIQAILGVHDKYDLALLKVEPPHQATDTPIPLALAAEPPPRLEGQQVYLIGYPVRDARRNEPEPIVRIFRDVYNVKRVQPGTLRGVLQFRGVQLLQHDCAMLGDSAGSCLVDLESHQVLGLQLTGRYLEVGTAIPLWVLRDDAMLQRAGVTFAKADAKEVEALNDQVERLARSRYWSEARAAITGLYQRAFGNSSPKKGGKQ